MREITYLEAVREACREEMYRDETVFLMGEDVGRYGGVFGATRGLLNEFGAERVRNTPISEASFVGLGIGAAATGMRPVLEIMYIDWITLAMEQIVNHAAKLHYVTGGQLMVPIVIRTTMGATSNAQHAQSLHAWFVHIPGLKVVLPSTPYDMKGLLKTAIRDNNPVLVCENRFLYPTKGVVPEEDYTIPIGVADVKREGSDLTIVATSLMVLKALAVAEELDELGLCVEVVDPRALVPLDKETILNSIRKTRRLLVVDEGYGPCGFGAEIAALAADEAFDYLDSPIKRIHAASAPNPYSPGMVNFVVPSQLKIMAAVAEMVGEELPRASKESLDKEQEMIEKPFHVGYPGSYHGE